MLWETIEQAESSAKSAQQNLNEYDAKSGERMQILNLKLKLQMYDVVETILDQINLINESTKELRPQLKNSAYRAQEYNHIFLKNFLNINPNSKCE